MEKKNITIITLKTPWFLYILNSESHSSHPLRKDTVEPEKAPKNATCMIQGMEQLP